MAFLDPFAGAPAIAVATAPAATRLDPLARRVVALSHSDTPASLLPPGQLARLFGLAHANRLADPALEAMRAYAVMLRHGGDAVAAPRAEALAAHGYTAAQVAHARWLVCREGPGAAPARGVSRLALGCAILLSVWLGMLAGHATADATIGLVAGLLVAVSLAPLIAIDARPRRRRRGGGVGYA